MYICICRAVTDKQIETAIDAGATTLQAVTRACEAGGDCGACHGFIEDMLEDRGCCSKRRLPIVEPIVEERAA